MKQDYWSFWAADARRTGSELYARLANAIGHDAELRALAEHARKGQPPANMMLAAVHHLLLRGASHPLARFYPSVGGSVDTESADPFPDFRDFVLQNRVEIAALIESRVTNTNEVGRSALLHLGFRALAKIAPEPLHLVEIGPSAGLNLIWDRYGVRYLRDGTPPVAISPEAPLLLETELRGGEVVPSGPIPRVASRVGLELNPVDLSNEDDCAWLRALVWPGERERASRLEKAIHLFNEAPVEVRAGDALALLPDALAAVPPAETLCVFHTIALYQFNREMKEGLEAILTTAGVRRAVFRLGFEFDGTEYVLSLERYFDGTREERVLAVSHPHGRWIEWKA